jgi:glycosyltransferase involved in cell wall biosynthesis
VRFSLIMATMGRPKEATAFITLLRRQTFTGFELIVVDQNDDDQLAEICRALHPGFPVHHVRSSVKRLSHARNVGMRFCSGEIVAFPDDDCMYPEDLLLSVHRSFLNDPQIDVLTGTAVSPSGSLGSGRWSKTSGDIRLETVWTSAIAFNLFIKAPLLRKLQGFDENLGVGARFGSCEETDLVIRALKAGARAVYDPSKAVIHPDKRLTPVAIARAYDYGAGMGYVLRKHRIKPSTYIVFFVRPLGGVIVSLARLRVSAAKYYWNTLRGRLYGFVAFAAEVLG